MNLDTKITPQERETNINRWRAVSYALVTVMLTCGAMTLVAFLHQVEPSWQLFYLELIAFVVTLDRLYLHQRFKRLIVFSSEWFARFIGQWVVLAVFIRLTISLMSETALDSMQVLQSPQAFLEFFFSIQFIFVLILAGLFWMVAGQFADLLDDLSDQESIVRLSLNFDTTESRTPRQRLVSLIFIVGGALVLMTAFARLDVRWAVKLDLNTGLPAYIGPGGSTLLYFLCALVLLSLSQFLELHTVWSLHKIPINVEVGKRWPLYSLMFLGLLTLLVSLLPTQYGLGLFGLLNYLLSIVLYFLFLIAQLFVLFGVFVLTLVAQLFKFPPPDMRVFQPVPVVTPIPTQQPATVPLPSGWELLNTTILWIALGAILIFAVTQYLRSHQGLLKALRRGKSWNILNWFWKFFGGVKVRIDQIVEAGRARLQRGRSGHSSSGYMSLRRLDPRQRVRFFYLALIRRGAETGLSRSPTQTPQEYAATLDRALPEAEADIDALTGEFIKARYTRADVAPEEATQVKSWWERIKKVLQNKKAESGK